MDIFSIISSNYTGSVFAWPGAAKEQRKYLGNRKVIAEIEAADADSALAAWCAKVGRKPSTTIAGL